MKKITVVASLAISLIASTAFANQEFLISKKPTFAPQSWYSQTKTDIKYIKNGSDNAWNVQIYVSEPNGISGKLTGANIAGCGNVTHIDPGSSAICKLSPQNPIIGLASDSDTIPAQGVYQVE